MIKSSLRAGSNLFIYYMCFPCAYCLNTQTVSLFWDASTVARPPLVRAQPFQIIQEPEESQTLDLRQLDPRHCEDTPFIYDRQTMMSGAQIQDTQPSHRLPRATYQYAPLKEGEVRLMHLLPVTGDDPSLISCQLYHVPIDSMPPYEALSYSWETDLSGQTPHPTIYVDGKELKIMPSLEAFLRQHRHDHDSDLPLWIDAICVNQNDLVERRKQVAMMCRLYTQLARLVIWLGIDDDAEIKIATEFIQQYASAQREGQESVRKFQENLISRFRETGFNYSVLLNKFLSRSWFVRSWIVQEYVLGSQKGTAVFKCGSLQLSLDDMKALAFFLHWHWLNYMAHAFRAEASAGFTQCSQVWMSLEFAQDNRRLGLLDQAETNTDFVFWLAVLRDQLATDPRDKVYAALGLAQVYGQSDHSRVYNSDVLIVDYTASIQSVYSSLVKSLVESTKRLNVLLACSGRSFYIDRSWTPDWSVPSLAVGFMGLYYGSIERSKKDGFCSSGTEDAFATFADDLSALTVRGLRWNKVKETLNISDQRIQRFVSDNPGAASTATVPIPRSWLDEGPYASKRNFVLTFCQTMDLEIGGHPGDLLSEDEFVALGLNEITNSTTTTLHDDSLSSHLDLLTPSFMERIDYHNTRNTQLFITGKGFLGKDFSGVVETGDIICVLLGCPAPVALRQVGSHYEFIRSVYVDGIMYGEAIEALKRGEVELEDFELH